MQWASFAGAYFRIKKLDEKQASPATGLRLFPLFLECEIMKGFRVSSGLSNM